MALKICNKKYFFLQHQAFTEQQEKNISCCLADAVSFTQEINESDPQTPDKSNVIAAQG